MRRTNSYRRVRTNVLLSSLPFTSFLYITRFLCFLWLPFFFLFYSSRDAKTDILEPMHASTNCMGEKMMKRL